MPSELETPAAEQLLMMLQQQLPFASASARRLAASPLLKQMLRTQAPQPTPGSSMWLQVCLKLHPYGLQGPNHISHEQCAIMRDFAAIVARRKGCCLAIEIQLIWGLQACSDMNHPVPIL